MGLVETINNDLKTSMKERDKSRTQALRGIRAAFIEALKSDGAAELSDEACLTILRKLAKSRAESIAAYTAGNRLDLVAEEQVELDIIEAYLPKLADEATTRAWVAEAVAATGAAAPADMGKVMGALMAAHKAELDGKLVSRLVREALAG